MRLFLAINFPEPLQQRIVDATNALRSAAPEVRWVHEPLIHLTVKFLGDVEESRLDAVRRSLTSVASSHFAMSIQLAGAGAFPNMRRARVVWLGVNPEPRLELLHHDLEIAYAAIGFEIEGRPFRPHATLGRMRQPLAPATSRRLAAAARAIAFEEEHVVASVELMESQWSEGRTPYGTLLTAPLRQA